MADPKRLDDVQAVISAWRASDYDDLIPLEFLAPVAQIAVDALAAAGWRPPTTPSPPMPWEVRAAATGGGPCSTCGAPFYTHVCLGCSPDYQTPGPGCVNCRNTGMDQTPCLPPRSKVPA